MAQLPDRQNQRVWTMLAGVGILLAMFGWYYYLRH